MEPQLRKNLQDVTTQSIVNGLWKSIKKLLLSLTKLWNNIVKKEKEIEIPKEWLSPSTDVVPNPAPVAVKPTIVFEEFEKHGLALTMPWLIGAKRILAFILMIICIASMYWTARSFPYGLLFTGPSVFISLDYLIKTRSKKKKAKWYMLQDLEEER